MIGFLASKTFRIGTQTLWYQDVSGSRFYYVSIRNRTYNATVMIPEERIDAWVEALT
jgi:hypothetical protein